MKCPQCDETMTKAFIETGTQYGWKGGWLCGCKKEDYERDIDIEDDIVFITAYSKIGEEVNKILTGKQND